MNEIEFGHALSGIVFRDVSSGLRAGLVTGPDVREVVAVRKDFDGRDAAVIAERLLITYIDDVGFGQSEHVEAAVQTSIQ